MTIEFSKHEPNKMNLPPIYNKHTLFYLNSFELTYGYRIVSSLSLTNVQSQITHSIDKEYQYQYGIIYKCWYPVLHHVFGKGVLGQKHSH